MRLEKAFKASRVENLVSTNLCARIYRENGTYRGKPLWSRLEKEVTTYL
jgi:hypothetical protein